MCVCFRAKATGPQEREIVPLYIIQQLCAAKNKPDMGDCHFNVRLAMKRVEGHVIFIFAVRGRIFA